MAPPGAARCFKSRNLDEIRLNVSRFQLSAQAPVDNGLVREHRSDPGAESIVVTSPLLPTPRHLDWHLAQSGPVRREQSAGSRFRFLFSGKSSGNEPDVSKLWDAQHIAEIFYLQYFYVVVYSDDSWLIACGPMICSTYGKICLNAPQTSCRFERWRKVNVSCPFRVRWSVGIFEMPLER